VQLYRYSVS